MSDLHLPLLRCSEFRFYGQLNDFLPRPCRQLSRTYRYSGFPALRDSIQAQGVPHPEVDRVLVNGCPTDYSYRLRGGERISVYPRFLRFDTCRQDRLAADPLAVPCFILDVHLGKLCRHLRLLGFDTVWGNDFEDSYIIDRALAEQRIILTRDLGLLKQGRVRHGYYVRSVDPDRQIGEVMDIFCLMEKCQPLNRCIRCNGRLESVLKSAICQQLPPGTSRSYETFYRCLACQQIYWRGAHYVGLMGKLARSGQALPPSG